MRLKIILTITATIGLFCFNVNGAEYHVGPSKKLTTLSGINWDSLRAGDTVYIHARNNKDPYYERFTVSSVGTQDRPIRVIGVPDTSGNLPIIDGRNATTPATTYWRASWLIPQQYQIEDLSLIGINPTDTKMPTWIEIKNLEIRNANVLYTFTARDGLHVQKYNEFCAGIRVHGGRNILIENCIFNANNQGIFIKEGGGDVWWDALSKDVTVRGCWFINNGLENNYSMHQIYAQGERITVEYCRFSANLPTAMGSHLKTRDAGDIVRYNIFETKASNDGWYIDLVEPEDPWIEHFKNLNTYRQVHVYGNIFILDNKPINFINFGSDRGVSVVKNRFYNGGKLLFYYNTVYIKADLNENGSWFPNVTLFHSKNGGYDQCATESEFTGSINILNNIIISVSATQGGTPAPIVLSRCASTKIVLGNNWISSRWTSGVTRLTQIGEIHSPHENDPGFVSPANMNFRLTESSNARNAAGKSIIEITDSFLGLNLIPSGQYKGNLKLEERPSIMDLGAYEYGLSIITPENIRLQ